MKKGETKNCAWCGADVYRCPSLAKLYKEAFCSKEHNVLWMKDGAFSFKCVICEKVVLTQPAQMKLRNRQTCSMECRGKLKRTQAEKRREKYGYTKHQLDRLARYSPEAQEWRRLVFERDDYTCQACGIRGGKLEADHIKPWAYFEDLRFELDNGRTLCRGCHDKTKISAKAMRKQYQTKLAELSSK